VDRLEGTFKLFGATLEQWLECQKGWMHLEGVFAAPDIQRQLPEESKAFAQVSHWKGAAASAQCTPLIIGRSCLPSECPWKEWRLLHKRLPAATGEHIL